jgi:uncharacterized protein (TIGR03000 family)
MRSMFLATIVGLSLFTSGVFGQPPAGNQPVHMKFVVPADAQIWLNDALTTMQGPVRQFLSPPVKPGQSYIYTVRVRWQRYGQIIDQKRDIAVKAGDFVDVNFEGELGGYTSTPVITFGERAYYSPPRQRTPVYFSLDQGSGNRIGWAARQNGILSYYGATPGWGSVDSSGLR